MGTGTNDQDDAVRPHSSPPARHPPGLRSEIAADAREAIDSHEYVRLLRSHRSWRILAAIALIGAVVVALLGGFRSAVPSDTGAAHAVGTPMELGAYTMTPLSARLSGRRPAQDADVTDGRRFLAVQLRVVNNTDSGTYMPTLDRSLVLTRKSRSVEIKPDDVVWADTGSRGIVLPPKLPVQVALVWEVPAGAVVDEVIEIGAYQTVQSVSRITLAPEWGRGARAGFWRIPVTVE